MIEFLYRGEKCYTNNLAKKLKRMKITEADIVILREYDETIKKEKDDIKEDTNLVYYVYQNPRGYYLYSIGINNLSFYEKMNIDVSEYKLIDVCTKLKSEYYRWNPETKTGRKDII